MKSIEKMLQLLGFWTQPYQKQNRTVMPLIYVAVYVVWLIIPGIVFLVRRQLSYENFSKTAIETISIIHVVCLTLNAFIHRLVLEKTYQEIRFAMQAVSVDGHHEILGRVKQLESSTDRFFKVYIRFEIVVGFAYLVYAPMLSIIRYALTGQLPPLSGLFEADFYFVDFTNNFNLWLLVIIISWAVGLNLVIVLFSVNSLCWCLLYHINGLFQVVCLKVSRLNDFSNTQVRMQELAITVELQELLYRFDFWCVRSMEKSLSGFMLIQFGTCIIMTCMTMMALSLGSHDKDLLIKMVTMLSYILFHILVYSLLGTELITTSTSVADAIYAVQWYRWSTPEQRIVLFILNRSQRMAKLTTGKFFVVNRHTFGKTMQTAISYFAVLLQLYGSQ